MPRSQLVIMNEHINMKRINVKIAHNLERIENKINYQSQIY